MYYLGEVRPDSNLESLPAGTSDPYNTGRLKVWVRGVHPTELYNQPDLLPWAVVLYPSSNAGTGGTGNSSGSIEAGAQVFVTFTDEDKQHPFVFGVIPRVESSADAGPYGGYDRNGDYVGGGAGGESYTPTPSGTWTPEEGDIGTGEVAPEDRFWRDIVRWCVNTRGLNLDRAKNIASGVVGCSYHETFVPGKFKPYQTNAQNSIGGGQGAKGLFQWRGSRQTQLRNTGDKDWGKYKNQIAHFFHENETNESAAWNRVEGNEGSKNPQRVAAVFGLFWLRYVPGGTTLSFQQIVAGADKLSKNLDNGEGSTYKRMKTAIRIHNDYANQLISGIDYDPTDPTGAGRPTF